MYLLPKEIADINNALYPHQHDESLEEDRGRDQVSGMRGEGRGCDACPVLSSLLLLSEGHVGIARPFSFALKDMHA